MSGVLAWVKAHPVGAGLSLFGVFAVLIIVLFSGGKTTAPAQIVTAGPLSDTAQSTALQQAQLAAGIQATAISTQATTDQAAIAAARDVQLKNSDVSLANIYATADTNKYVATLGAQVANNQTDAAKSINDAKVSAATQIAQIQASTTLQVAGLQKDVAYDTNFTQLTMFTAQNNAAINRDTLNYYLGAQANNLAYAATAQKNNLDYAANINSRAIDLSAFNAA